MAKKKRTVPISILKKIVRSLPISAVSKRKKSGGETTKSRGYFTLGGIGKNGDASEIFNKNLEKFLGILGKVLMEKAKMMKMKSIKDNAFNGMSLNLGDSSIKIDSALNAINFMKNPYKTSKAKPIIVKEFGFPLSPIRKLLKAGAEIRIEKEVIQKAAKLGVYFIEDSAKRCLNAMDKFTITTKNMPSDIKLGVAILTASFCI